MLKRKIHPGLILQDELLELGISSSELSRQINVPANRLSQLINAKRSITGDTALRLGHWFGINPQFWMNLQSQYDLAVAREGSGDQINKLPTRSEPA